MSAVAKLAILAAALLAAAAAFEGSARGSAAPGLYDGVPPFLLKADHDDLKAELAKRAVPLDVWAEGLDFDYLCLGETHSSDFRAFYAERVLPKLRLDRLLLEETQPVVDALVAATEAGQPASLLNAPIDGVLRAVRARNPAATFAGVEATQDQETRILDEARLTGHGRLSRDGFIGLNALSAWPRGARVATLIGALHCSRLSEGLGFDVPFFRLLQPEVAARAARAINARLVARNDAVPLRAVLQRYGLLIAEPIALTTLGSVPPSAYGYREDFRALFEGYDVLLIAP